MSRFFSNIKDNATGIYRILIFLSAIALVVYILPREGKFPYEYSKGKPWKHEMLIAPFDFPVYKSQAELENERDSILDNFRPYFNFDTLRKAEQANRISIEFENKKENLSEKYPFLEKTPERKDSSLWSIVKETTRNELIKIYNKGLINLPEQYINAGPSFELILVRNNFAEPSGSVSFIIIRALISKSRCTYSGK